MSTVKKQVVVRPSKGPKKRFKLVIKKKQKNDSREKVKHSSKRHAKALSSTKAIKNKVKKARNSKVKSKSKDKSFNYIQRESYHTRSVARKGRRIGAKFINQAHHVVWD
eukprot:278523_1